ncbi:MAG: hypothetical protein FWD47_15585 [Treponema sp.]|nr:hypothetical protein [Treponema sp.]
MKLFKSVILTFLFIFIATICNTCITYNNEQINIVNGLQPIDIRSPGFFWLLQPWKEGKLATIDGRGRFAEISFVGTNRMRITPLVNFPRMQLDRRLNTWPEAGLIVAQTADRMHHLAAIDDNITKSHIPMLTWQHIIPAPVLVNHHEKLISYMYVPRNNSSEQSKLFIYNYKEDRIVFENPDNFSITFSISMNDQYILAQKRSFNESTNRMERRRVFYDWRTTESNENDLTNELRRIQINLNLRTFFNNNLHKRYLFGNSEIFNERVMVTWDEDFSNIKTIPLSYLAPEGKRFRDFVTSSNGNWATTLIWGYRGLYNEDFHKRAFFHLDARYPNGISMPIITDDYEEFQSEYSAFVNHPIHGMCFAQEWRKNGRLYLRLYKMSDVLAEIDKQM